MPSPNSKKSPKSKGSPSPKSKGSPNNKNSPKGTKSPAKETAADQILPFFRPPPPPTPPPPPPDGPILSKLRRQVWYPEANRASFVYGEWYWSPLCPVITSWGDIWITDPPQRRILRYEFDPIGAKISQKTPSIITRGEPKMMIEIPKTGRMAVLLTCPVAMKTTLTLFDPRSLTEVGKIDYGYCAEIPPQPELPGGPTEPTRQFPPLLLDDSTPSGLCANSDILFVLFNPIQKMRLYDPLHLKPIDLRLENGFPDESTCVHMATSCGCAASEDRLFVAATRPPRIQVFWIHRQKILSSIDRTELTWYAELGLDRMAYSQPFGIQIDSLGLVAVSDSRAGFIRVYNTTDRRPPGPWLPSLPHGETSFFGSWKIDAYQGVRPGYFSLAKNGTACIVDRWANKIIIVADRTVLRWYDETHLILDEAPFLRPVIDPLMPVNGLPPPPQVAALNAADFRRTVSDKSEPIEDNVLIPESLARRYKTKEELEQEQASPKVSPKKNSPKKNSPKDQKKSKSGSPKSSSGKSSKKK